MKDGIRNSTRSGFTLLEMLLVVAIGLIVTSVAVPNVVVAISSARLRASMTSLSGVLQSARMSAVKQNMTMTTHFDSQTQGLIAYNKLATNNSTVLTSDTQIEMQAPVIQVNTLSGVGTPTVALDQTVLGYTPQSGDPSFNSRGMPCVYNAGTCTNYGFLYYFHDTRPSGNQGWAAVTISPAGRITKWFWSGSAWTN